MKEKLKRERDEEDRFKNQNQIEKKNILRFSNKGMKQGRRRLCTTI